MTNVKEIVTHFNKWYDGLKKHSRNFPAKGTIAGALVILERLKEEFTLDIEAHTAKGGSQIKGASGEAVKGILERFGEKRPFVAEGGRTNRGLRGDIKKMLDSLRDSKISGLTGTERNDILSTLQRILVEKVKEFHSQERLKIVYDPSKSTRQLIHEILESAKEHEKYGPIAQYLVGAKLQLRFPDEEIRNDSYSTADQKQKKPGDFSIEDTIFHVTVSPMEMVFDKCRANLACLSGVLGAM